MKKNHIFGIIGIIIVALIVLAIVVPGKGENEKTNKDASVVTLSAPATYAVEGEEFVYAFDGINWDLDLIEAGSARVPETRVGFFFDNFSRRADGVAATFGSPFHLGFYKGDCAVLETLPEDNALLADIEGSIISAIACVWQEEASLVLLGQQDNIITAYSTDSTNPEEMDTVRKIDITTIVE